MGKRTWIEEQPSSSRSMGGYYVLHSALHGRLHYWDFYGRPADRHKEALIERFGPVESRKSCSSPVLTPHTPFLIEISMRPAP